MNVKPNGKRWLAAFLCVVLSLSLAACSGGNSETTTSQTAATQTTAPVTTAPTGNPSESDTMSQDELDIEAAKEKSVYTEDGVATDDSRLDAVVASCADYSINNRDAQIYYAMQYYNFMNNYGFYASVFGLDSTKPLSEQVSTVDTLSWEQYFLMSALDDFHLYAALATKAAAEGYTLPEQDQNKLAEVRDGLKQRYAEFGFDSEDAYVQSNFGGSVRYEDYVRYLELYFYAMSYYNSVYHGLSVSDEQINTYYEEHPEDFQGVEKDTVGINVRHILISCETEEGATEEQVNAAREAAKAKAEELLAEWQKDPTEERFSELAKENTADPGSQSNGGLYENVIPGQMVESFNDWCFDASRKPGDTGIVETEYGYHVMYFVSQSEQPYWIVKADEGARYYMMVDTQDALLAEYPMTTSYENAILVQLPKQ